MSDSGEPQQTTRKRTYELSDDFFSLPADFNFELPKRTKLQLEDEDDAQKSGDELREDHQTQKENELSLHFFGTTQPLMSQRKYDDFSDDDDIITPSITVDREAIRKKIAERIRLQSKYALLPDEEDEELETEPPVEEDDDLVVLEDILEKKESSEASNEYTFTDANEKNRRYIIRVFSKLPIPAKFTTLFTDFGAKGTKKFSRSLIAINKYYANIFKPLDPAVVPYYNPEYTTLIWIEGKMEIKPFFKLSTLRIPPPDMIEFDLKNMPPTKINCILIPKHLSSQFLTLYPEFKSTRVQPEEEEIVERVQYEDSSDDDGGVINEDIQVNHTEPEVVGEGTFVIGLKGKDNKRVEVRVSPATKIMSILTHYCNLQKIDPNSLDLKKVKLIFDDESLDLSDIVGNTELEDDFEIQVVI